MASMDWRSRKMAMALNSAGRISARWLLMRPTLLMTMKRGMDSTCPGIIIEARNSMNSTLRPGNSMRENAKAAMEETTSWKIVALRETNSEFLMKAKKSTFSKACR